ncbi:MAG TPA: hypothetical protein ENK25_09090 [Bacteroidetes bacterium]|nr:hypothetical protein [Bacteroidota bacterium]
MGKMTGIWLDSEKAYVITLVNGTQAIEEIESPIETRVRIEGEKKQYSRVGGMFVNPQKKKTKRHEQQLKKYYDMIINKIKDSDAIYIFGPSNTPKRFYKELLQDKQLASKLVGFETEGKMTRNQMIAKVKNVYAEKLTA